MMPAKADSIAIRFVESFKVYDKRAKIHRTIRHCALGGRDAYLVRQR